MTAVRDKDCSIHSASKKVVGYFISIIIFGFRANIGRLLVKSL